MRYTRDCNQCQSLTALFKGSEYSDGTMRNKIVVGHKRCNVYLSNLIVCTTAGILLCIAYIAPHICVGIPLLGGFESGFGTIMTYTGLSLALTMASVSVFTLISMLCYNKAYFVAICIILSFTLLFAGIRILSALNEPEYFGAYSNGKQLKKKPKKIRIILPAQSATYTN